MKHLDDVTILKAERIFNQHGTVATGYGLSRKELRLLERQGLIEKRLMKNKDTGALIYEWKPVSYIDGLVGKK